MTSVSICVSNYNYGRFLPAALESVLGQDHGDVEVVVVDDGSTDDSLDVLRRYRSQVDVIAKENGGQASAMNAGFAATTGRLVIFLDADDVLLPGALERFARAFEADERLVKVASRLQVIDSAGRPTGDVRPPPHWSLPAGDLRSHVLRRRSYVWPASSGNCYRRSALEQCMPIPAEQFRIEADLYLATLIALEGPIGALSEPAVGYRLHGANNYAGGSTDASFLRRKMERIEHLHRLVVSRANDLGGGVAGDAADTTDPAYLSYRLASLVLDPAGHPHPADRRVRLGLRAASASASQPGHPLRSRIRRAAWAAAVGLAPRAVARRAVGARFS